MGWKFPILKRCCCCIPLRTGTMISGYVFLVFHFIAGGVTCYRMAVREFNDDVTTARAYVMYTFQICSVVVYLILNVMLIFGAHKNKPEYLRHFFTASMVVIVANIVIIAVRLLFYHVWIYWLIIYLTITVLNFYLLLVVRSAYLNMEETDIPRLHNMRCQECC